MQPRVWLLLLFSTLLPTSFASGVLVAKHRRRFDKDNMEKLQRNRAHAFRFARFQTQAAVKAAFDGCRSRKSFKDFEGKDGRKGRICSTKLSGDWVLAESEQTAPSCTCEQVLRAYLDGALSKRWNSDKIMDVKFTRRSPRGRDAYYQQDLKIHSQRVIRSHTGIMRYSQRITIDKIGRNAYCAFVQLDPEQLSTAKKPFNSLSVYVGLQQDGDDVKIYAAGIMEVNRRVVPNLVVFDASSIAGDQAGKGTLWLASHFDAYTPKYST